MIKSENKTREEHTMVIKVENLVKRYGDLLALDHFRLEVEQGDRKSVV